MERKEKRVQNLGFRNFADVREARLMYLCLATSNVDFLSREYTLYYKADMGG